MPAEPPASSRVPSGETAPAGVQSVSSMSMKPRQRPCGSSSWGRQRLPPIAAPAPSLRSSRTPPLPPPTTSTSPSGDQRPAFWPSPADTSESFSPEAASHSVIWPVEPIPARCVPSADQATSLRFSPEILRRQRPLEASQIQTPPPKAAASCSPSGDQDRPVISLACPSSLWRHWPLWVSQMVARLLRSPLASRALSGDQRTRMIQPSWPSLRVRRH